MQLIYVTRTGSPPRLQLHSAYTCTLVFLGKGNPKPDGAESKVTNAQVLWLHCLSKMNVNPCKVYVQCYVCRKQARTFFICLDQRFIITMILEAKRIMMMLYFYGCSITFNVSTVRHCIISSTFPHNTAWRIRYLLVVIRWALISFLAEELPEMICITLMSVRLGSS